MRNIQIQLLLIGSIFLGGCSLFTPKPTPVQTCVNTYLGVHSFFKLRVLLVASQTPNKWRYLDWLIDVPCFECIDAMQPFMQHPDPSTQMLAKYLISNEIAQTKTFKIGLDEGIYKKTFKKETLVALNHYLDSTFSHRTSTPLLTVLEAYQTYTFIAGLDSYLDSIFQQGNYCCQFIPAKPIPPQFQALRDFWGDSISPIKLYHQALLRSPDADFFCKLFAPIANATQQRFPDVRMLNVYHVYCELRLPDYRCYYPEISKLSSEKIYGWQYELIMAEQAYEGFMYWLAYIKLSKYFIDNQTRWLF